MGTRVIEGTGELRNVYLLFPRGCERYSIHAHHQELYPPKGEQGFLSCWYSSGRRRVKPEFRS